jgi:biotin carboxylase
MSISKTIMIIGAGLGQIPAIKKGKELGLRVIVVDRDLQAPGMDMADISLVIDVADLDGVLNAARDHGIDGIMTMQSDLPVPTVGYVNDQLGLPGVSLEVANWCSNKLETRFRLQSCNCEQPGFCVARTIEEAEDASVNIGFPCVVKAVDSSGSRGVTKVNNLVEVESAYKEALKYSRQNEVLVEEFIDGLEFGAQTFSINGKCELVLMHNDTISLPPYMIPIGHSFPFIGLSDREMDVASQDIKAAVEALGIANGPSNVDILVDVKTKRVKIIEIGARIGATCLPELVKHFTGIDWVSATINAALGNKIDLKLKKTQPVAALIIQSPADGIFQSYKQLVELNEYSVCEFEVVADPGQEVSLLRKGTDRIGKVVCLGATVTEAEQNAKQVFDATIISVD